MVVFEVSVTEEIICCQKSTNSLALYLIDPDIGYSSNKAGGKYCAYFLDDVDNTFTGQEESALCHEYEETCFRTSETLYDIENIGEEGRRVKRCLTKMDAVVMGTV